MSQPPAAPDKTLGSIQRRCLQCAFDRAEPPDRQQTAPLRPRGRGGL